MAIALPPAWKPTPQENTLLEKLFSEQRELFSGDAEAAQKLLSVGETKNDPSLHQADVAAGTVLAEALLNHDECIMRR